MVALGLNQKVSNGGNVVGNRKINYTSLDCWKHREKLAVPEKIYHLASSLVCLCMTADPDIGIWPFLEKKCAKK